MRFERLSPPWLDGGITVPVLSQREAREVCAVYGVRLPRTGWEVRLTERGERTLTGHTMLVCYARMTQSGPVRVRYVYQLEGYQTREDAAREIGR